MNETFTLIIGNKNYSSWSLRPWILMKYFNIAFDEVLIPLFQEGSKQQISIYSPSGKVPALVVGKDVIWDSLSIAEYLAETFPVKHLWPQDKNMRALARSVSAEMHSSFQALRSLCPMNVKASRPPKEQTKDLENDIKRIKSVWEEFRKTYQKQGDFLFGQFSIADAMFAPVIFRFRTYGIVTEGLAQKYYQTMLNLPALKEWEMAALKETWVINH